MRTRTITTTLTRRTTLYTLFILDITVRIGTPRDTGSSVKHVFTGETEVVTRATTRVAVLVTWFTLY